MARAATGLGCVNLLRVKPVPPAIGSGGLLQQGQIAQTFGCQRLTLRQQRRAAHRHHRFVHQFVGTGARPVANLFGRTGVERRVKCAVCEKKGPGSGVDVNRDVGVLLCQPPQLGNQPMGGEGGHGGQGQVPAAALLRHRFKGIALQPFQALAHLARIGLPRRRQADTMPGSTKKSQAKEILQQADLPGHCTLCERQLFGSLSVALVFCGRFKANQGLGGGDFATHEGAGKI